MSFEANLRPNFGQSPQDSAPAQIAPNTNAATGADQVDYISKADLEGYLNNYPLQEGHAIQAIIPLNMPPTQYFEQYLSNEAPYFFGEFFKMRGENNVQ